MPLLILMVKLFKSQKIELMTAYLGNLGPVGALGGIYKTVCLYDMKVSNMYKLSSSLCYK